MVAIITKLVARGFARIGAPGGRVLALACALLAPIIASVDQTAVASEKPQATMRRVSERKVFTDAEITQGFFKLTFGAEFHTAGRVDRIRKYDGPVRVFIDSRAKPDRTSQVTDAVAKISEHVRHLDISVTRDRAEANMIVTVVRDRDLNRTIRSVYGPARARSIRRSLDPQCLSGFRKDESFRIAHSEVILVADAGEFVFRECVYEEMLQALGPINDDDSIPWTMFNDNVHVGFFDVYDQYILNLLYHPRIRPGMTRAEVTTILPEILPEVRAFVREVNRLP